MRKKSLILVAAACGAVLAFALFHSSPASAAEELDPLIVCRDTQKLVFENEFVRVVEERVPAGVSQVKHAHRHGVSIALSDYTNEEKNFPSGQVVRRSRKAGDAGWRDASVHESRNVGTVEEHLIRVELKY